MRINFWTIIFHLMNKIRKIIFSKKHKISLVSKSFYLSNFKLKLRSTPIDECSPLAVEAI